MWLTLIIEKRKLWIEYFPTLIIHRLTSSGTFIKNDSGGFAYRRIVSGGNVVKGRICAPSFFLAALLAFLLILLLHGPIIINR